MRRPALLLAALLLATTAAAGPITPGPAVTDANVVERVRHLRTRADQLALANYYAAKAAAEGPRIEFYEQLFRAYKDLEGKQFEPLREQARDLLRAARRTKQHLEILSTAHRNRSLD